jgi:VanZ family protein
VRRFLLPLLWFAVILTFSTDAFSAAVTGGLLHRLLDALLPGLSPESFAAIHLAVRKGAHLFEYAVLATLFRPAVAGSNVRALALTVAAAAIDEAHQATTATRTGAVTDVGVDALGAVLGLATIALTRRWRDSVMRSSAPTRAALLVLAAGLLLAGCGGLRTHRLDLRYTPAPGLSAGYPAPAAPMVVALAPTRDARGLTDPVVIGRRVTSRDEVEPMVPAGERTEAIVTEAIRRRLAMDGYTVRPLPAWDLRAESLDPSWGDAVVGAEVLEFWTEARSRHLKTTQIASRGRVRLVLADPRARRIVWMNTVESVVQAEVNLFETSDATSAASEVLTAAIRSLLEGRDLTERLRALR